MVHKDMEDTDADMGYIKLYIREIHDFLLSGNTLSKEDILKVKQAHELIQSAYCCIFSKMTNPKKFPD